MVKLPIYMDHHATTPVDRRVLEAMLPYFCDEFGNAASVTHEFGRRAAEAVERARAQVAALIGAESREIIFTSGATEANNLAIKGVAWMHASRGRHIITCATEHHAVLDPCRRLEREGWELTVLPVDEYGLVDPDDVRRAIRPDTVLISIMAANNEIGTIHEVAEIGRSAREHGVLFHTDATQAVGHIPVDVRAWGVDLLSCSAHKLYGPKGIGALFVRRGRPPVRLAPLLDGGGHERGLRSGTLPVPLIVGFGAACALAGELLDQEAARLRELRDRLQERIMASLEEVYLNGHPQRRLPGNLNLSFAYVDGEALLMSLPEVALSSGSACTSATPHPSHVLAAIGRSEELARASLRFGLGRSNTREEVDFVAERVVAAVRKLREMSAIWKTRVD